MEALKETPEVPLPPLGKSEAERLLRECRDRVLGKVGKLLAAMLDAIEVELRQRMAIATTADEKKVLQQALFVAVGDRKTVESEFRSKFLELFDAFAAGKGRRHLDRDKNASGALGELSLVDDSEMEENIIVKRLEGFMREGCNDDLFNVERRLSVLLDQETISDENNPLGPGVLIEAFRSGCRSALPDTAARMALLRSVNKEVLQTLSPLYTEAEAHFSTRISLPERKARSRPQAPVVRSDERATGNENVSGASAVSLPKGATESLIGNLGQGSADSFADAGDDFSGDFLSRLNQVVASRGGDASGGDEMPGLPAISGALGGQAGGSMAALGNMSPAALAPLMGLLSALEQGRIAIMPAGDGAPAASASGLNPDLLAGQISQVGAPHNVLQSLRSSDAADALNSLETITIDVVAMMFDYIFDDESISPEMKGVIGRLQIPLLKVALLDRHFFASRKHPARRLVDRMAAVSNHCDLSVAAGKSLFDQLNGLVSDIQRKQEDDPAIFQQALDQFESYIAAFEEAEAETVRVAADEARAAEEREQRRERIRELISTRIGEDDAVDIPQVIQDFARGAWCLYLEQIMLNEGEDSATWNAAQQTFDDLLWSIQPKKHAAERELLVRRIPVLVSAIKACMKAANAFPFEEERLLSDLMMLHMAAMKAAVDSRPKAKPAPVEEKSDDEMASELTRSVVLAQQVEAGRKAMSELRHGVWVEFIQEGEPIRVRLSWVSPARSKFVFTHKGSQAYVLSEADLSYELSSGRAKIVQNLDASLMDRAAFKAFSALESGGSEEKPTVH